MDYLFDDVRVEECLAEMVNQIRIRINGKMKLLYLIPKKERGF